MSNDLAQVFLDLARAHRATADAYEFSARAVAAPNFRPAPALAPSVAATPPAYPAPAPEYAPPAQHAPTPAARPAGTATGVVLAFGNSKGVDAAMAPTSDLTMYAKALEKSIADPEKAKWAQRNAQQLAVIRGELARRGANG